MTPSRITTLLLCLIIGSGLYAQEQPITVNLSASSITRAEAIDQINRYTPARVFYQEDQMPTGTTALDLREVTVREALDAILANTELDFIAYRDRVYVVGPAITIGTEFDAAYYAAVAEQLAEDESEADERSGPQPIGSFQTLGAGGVATVSGTIEDQGEPIIGATIQLQERPSVATTTGPSGEYAFSVEPGNYTMVISYVGYGAQLRPIKVNGDGTYDIELSQSATNLQEIVVTEQAADANVGRVQAGVQRLDLGQLEKLPTFMGETDVVKALLLNPGVSTIGEGATGFNVRGGEIDQNLLLQDNAILFNSSHALGFFSTYNADLLKSVDLYKANIPARFGGRLASVLDVEQRDGNFDHFRVKAGVGPVTGRVMLEGPIVKEQSSFIFGARSSYTGWVLNLASVEEVANSSAFFFDGNLRLTQRLGEKGTLVLSGYGSQDDFEYNETFAFDYRTLLGQAEYNAIFSDKAYGKLAVVYSDYQSSQSDLREVRAERIDNGVSYVSVKPVVNVEQSEDLSIEGGLEVIHYRTNPGSREPTSPESTTIPVSLNEETGLENSIFASATYEFSPFFSVVAGLRYTNYQYLGTDAADDGEEDASFGSLQPRISARYRLNAEASIRAGYSRTAQFINQIFVSDSPTPSSQFQLAKNGIPPFLSHNVSLGYFLNLNDNNVELGAEIYGRQIDQLWDYRDFAEVIVNPDLEQEILVGEGRAYGLELSAKRKVGTLNGLASYTFSRTERLIPGINASEYYPSNFDKPHNFVTTLNWNPNQRNTVTVNFTYGTGRPVTAPVGNYRLENGLTVPVYSDRNGVRIPDYHRLDIAYTLGKTYNEKSNLLTSWTISLYNVYARKNAFSVYYTQGADQTNIANRLAVLGTVFPSITLNIETR